MKQHVMVNGSQVPVEGLYRGNLMVRTEEESRRGYRAYMKARLVFDLFSLGTLAALLVLGTFWFLPVLGIALLVGFLVIVLTEVLAYRATRRALEEDGAYPGVYEEGVEMPAFPIYAIRLFIPWAEMEDAWVKRSRMLDDLLFMTVRNSRWRWRVPGRLMGEEGMEAVIARAGAPHAVRIPEPVQETPRLVVYSAEGAKTESVPEEG